MKTKVNSSSVYTRTLEDFGGLDCAHPPSGVAPNRFTKLENLWRDYAGGEGSLIETFPGFRCLATLPGAVRGIWRAAISGESYLMVHAGDSLYAWAFSETDALSLGEPIAVRGSRGKLSDAPSGAFVFGERFYLLDGTGYYSVAQSDAGLLFSEVPGTYLPVTYSDGEAYEQRNLLSDAAIARYHIQSPGAFSYGTPELKYRILSEEEGTCEVSGIASDFTGARVYVPGTVSLGGRTYLVEGIGNKAIFYCKSIERLYVSEGIRYIDSSAFYGCSSLVWAVLPDSLTSIRRNAFWSCPLETLVLGAGLTSIGEYAIASTSLISVTCHGEADTYWSNVTVDSTNATLIAFEKTYADNYPIQFYGFALYDPVLEITSLKLNGYEFYGDESRYFTISDGTFITALVLQSETRQDLTGGLLEIREKLSPYRFIPSPDHTDFSAANPGWSGSAAEALTHCTVTCMYDGRVFFSGNPDLPNTVFYAGRDLTGAVNPAYIGVLNYWNAGVGQDPVVALLPASADLAVCKGGDNSEGTILLYRGQDTGEDLLPRVYVLRETLAGESCVGGACNFGSDPVYLSRGGVESIGYESLSTARMTAHRSTLIDAALASHRGEAPLACVWDGYYMLLYPNGEAYLADGRRRVKTQTDSEYEWYHLTEVGGYTGDVPILRYAAGYPGEGAPELFCDGESVAGEISPAAGELPFGTTEESYPERYPEILSSEDASGEVYYFTRESVGGETHLYLLTGTGERTGGTFSPPTALAACGGKCLFGCENGQLFAVNTDQRRHDGRIPRELYSFGGHAILAGFETGLDLCGVPNYTKRTLRNTSVAELRAEGEVMLDVRVSHGRYFRMGEEAVTGGAGVAFETLDFRTVSFGSEGPVTLALRERSRPWVGKQYRIYARACGRPFGVHRIAYSWQIHGRVKNK